MAQLGTTVVNGNVKLNRIEAENIKVQGDCIVRGKILKLVKPNPEVVGILEEYNFDESFYIGAASNFLNIWYVKELNMIVCYLLKTDNPDTFQVVYFSLKGEVINTNTVESGNTSVNTVSPQGHFYYFIGDSSNQYTYHFKVLTMSGTVSTIETYTNMYFPQNKIVFTPDGNWCVTSGYRSSFYQVTSPTSFVIEASQVNTHMDSVVANDSNHYAFFNSGQTDITFYDKHGVRANENSWVNHDVTLSDNINRGGSGMPGEDAFYFLAQSIDYYRVYRAPYNGNPTHVVTNLSNSINFMPEDMKRVNFMENTILIPDSNYYYFINVVSGNDTRISDRGLGSSRLDTTDSGRLIELDRYNQLIYFHNFKDLELRGFD